MQMDAVVVLVRGNGSAIRHRDGTAKRPQKPSTSKQMNIESSVTWKMHMPSVATWNIQFENWSEFDWDSSHANPHTAHVYHKNNSENQMLCGLWLALLSLVASKRINHRQQSAKWRKAERQRILQNLILYKIIIGLSVTFRFTSTHSPSPIKLALANTHTPEPEHTHSTWEWFRCCQPRASIFVRTSRPAEEGICRIQPSYWWRVRRFLFRRFSSFCTAHKNFRMRRTLSAHLSRCACERTCVSE